MTKAKFYFLLFIAIIISGCNSKEQIAAFITIEAFEYTPGEDGIHSTKITDGWVYVDNEFLGAFDLPKTIPVLKSGQNSIIIDAGIRENGINALPNLYTFYKRFSSEVNLVPGATVTVTPTTTYDTDKTNFTFTDSFENPSHRFPIDLDGNGNTKIEINNSVVKEGNGAGRIFLDTDNPIIQLGSEYIEETPSFGVTAFIELDYKNDVPLLVGLAGYGNAFELVFSEVNLGVNPKTEWNKIYFNVSDKMEQLVIQGAVRYQIVFQAQIPRENGEFTMENAEIYLDNIKLVSF